MPCHHDRAAKGVVDVEEVAELAALLVVEESGRHRVAPPVEVLAERGPVEVRDRNDSQIRHSRTLCFRCHRMPPSMAARSVSLSRDRRFWTYPPRARRRSPRVNGSLPSPAWIRGL